MVHTYMFEWETMAQSVSALAQGNAVATCEFKYNSSRRWDGVSCCGFPPGNTWFPPTTMLAAIGKISIYQTKPTLLF